MEIVKEKLDNQIVLLIKGRLDTSSAPILEKEINELEKDISVVFDLNNLDYISSVGLRLILLTKKRYGDNFCLKNVKPEVLEILDMTGFSDIIKIIG